MTTSFAYLVIGLNKLALVGKAYVVMAFALYNVSKRAFLTLLDRAMAKLWQSCIILSGIAFRCCTILAKTVCLDANTPHTLSGLASEGI